LFQDTHGPRFSIPHRAGDAEEFFGNACGLWKNSPCGGSRSHTAGPETFGRSTLAVPVCAAGAGSEKSGIDEMPGITTSNRQSRRCRIKTEQAIKSIPYFAKFEEPPSLFSCLSTRLYQQWRLSSVVEFHVCFANQPTARRAAASFLDFKRFAERGLDSGVPIGGFAMELALMSHAEFGDLNRRRCLRSRPTREAPRDG
jgi:hypothetical protein